MWRTERKWWENFFIPSSLYSLQPQRPMEWGNILVQEWTRWVFSQNCLPKSIRKRHLPNKRLNQRSSKRLARCVAAVQNVNTTIITFSLIILTVYRSRWDYVTVFWTCLDWKFPPPPQSASYSISMPWKNVHLNITIVAAYSKSVLMNDTGLGREELRHADIQHGGQYCSNGETEHSGIKFRSQQGNLISWEPMSCVLFDSQKKFWILSLKQDTTD
jgi:hypothetical protein